MAYPDARILMLSRDGIQEVVYADTDHFGVTPDFLNNHQKMLEILMEN